jgi:hypothetical protein
MEMARGNKRARKSKDEVSSGTLGPAWPSSPTLPPKYVLYCANHENDRIYVVNSVGLYAIRKIFDALVGDNEIEPSPLDPDRTISFGDVDIKSDQMDAILAHQYSAEEEAFELPAPYPQQVTSFLTGGRISKALVDETRTVEGKVERAPPKPKIDRSQFITVQSIAEELKMDPRDARAALRKAKVEKPINGWLGDEKWASEIKVILVKAAAADKKAK